MITKIKWINCLPEDEQESGYYYVNVLDKIILEKVSIETIFDLKKRNITIEDHYCQT